MDLLNTTLTPKEELCLKIFLSNNPSLAVQKLQIKPGQIPLLMVI